MMLKDLMRKLPSYSTVHVHDKNGNFAYVGNPRQFITGLIAMFLVKQIIPLEPYCVEVIVEGTES